MTFRPRHLRQVIVVGQKVDGVLLQTIAWLEDHHWAVEQCKHIYTVAAILGQTNAEQVLVVGQPNVLVRHRSELLHLMVNTGALACGLISREDRYDGESVEELQANGLPVFMHLEAFAAWLTSKVDIERMSYTANGTDALDEQYQTTEAELAALLGEDDMDGGVFNATD